MDSKKKKLFFSVYAYLAVTIITVLLFFGVFSLVVHDRGLSLKKNIIEVNHTISRQELKSALKQIRKELEETHQPIIEWDEIRQQLLNPKYYSYWYQNRLISSPVMPEFIEHVELYSADKQILQGNASVEVTASFTPNMLGMNVYLKKNRLIVGYGFPITSRSDTDIHGYLHMEAELIRALSFNHALYSINPETLRYNISQNETIPFDSLSDRLIIPVTETSESIELTQLIDSVQGNLIITGIVISVIVWLLITYLFARPLSGLSNLIDRLRTNQDIQPVLEDSDWIGVTEVEKTRKSLIQFHDQLYMRNIELINSEKHMRTILDNVPDGILSIVNDDIIFSCNPAASQLFDMPIHEMAGKRLSRFVQLHGNSEITGIRRNGDTFPAELKQSELIGDSDIKIVIVRDISERKSAEAKLIQLANFDPLTNLPNRTLMRDRLDHAIQIAKRNNSKIGLFFLDLDRFKKYNDTLGHIEGDALLMEAANRLNKTVRESDTVARLGGDEFTIILENVNTTDELTEIAQNILENITQPMQLAGREITVSTSIGITVYPDDDIDPERLVKNADTAMYRAKELGGNNYQFFVDEMNIRVMQHLELENELRKALQNQEFRLYYQPRIDMQANQTVGAEVLIRWYKPDGRIIMPGTFIPNAEDTGLIIPLGTWILRAACEQIRIWQEQHLDVPRLSVNISPRQFREPGFVSMVEDILQETGVPPHYLEFEITEGMIIDNTEMVIETLNHLRKLGIVISLDDFGTGYSSLSYLKRLPIDIIKIDRSFVSDIPQNDDACSIVQAIIALSQGLKLSVIAEGIETQQQAEYLQQSGCNECQGYLYARPMPAQDFEKTLATLPLRSQHRS